MPDEASQIGQVLKAGRERTGLSQAAAAAKVGIDSVTLSRYERGKLLAPRPTRLALAALYDIPASDYERLGIEADSLGYVPRGTERSRVPIARQEATVSYNAEPRHLRNLPLEVRVYLDELRLKLTKGGATEDEVERAMALLRRPAIFSWYSVGTPKDLSPAKILQTMKAITESAILPYLREQGRKV